MGGVISPHVADEETEVQERLRNLPMVNQLSGILTWAGSRTVTLSDCPSLSRHYPLS